ncbi:MAG: hypothetical protein R3C56_15605 [Pirellulaceae bacterium]
MQSAQSLRLFADAGQQSAFDPDRFTGSPIFQLSARRTIIQSVDRNQGGFAVPKFVERAVLLGIVLAVPHAAWGADSEFPVLNSIGRFWGVGYTRGGYHAAQDGRFDIVTNRHPAPNYRPGGLPQYSQPIYSPPPASPSPVVAPTPTVQKSGDKSSAPKKSEAKPGAPEANELPRPVVPAKPAGPPPRWLEDYLQREAAEKRPARFPTPMITVSHKTTLLKVAPATCCSSCLRKRPVSDCSTKKCGLLDPRRQLPDQRPPSPRCAGASPDLSAIVGGSTCKSLSLSLAGAHCILDDSGHNLQAQANTYQLSYWRSINATT